MRVQAKPRLRAVPRIMVHGHRGACAILPENTLPGFEYAIGAGVDAIELDVAVTSDNVPVASHDQHLPSQAAIYGLMLGQLPVWLPTLDDVFALAPRGNFHFNVEIKSFPDHPELTPPP